MENPNQARVVRIAVVRATGGHITCVGPDDFKADDYPDAMNAAIGWHIEAGWMPAATYWIEFTLPPLNSEVPVIAAEATPTKDQSHG